MDALINERKSRFALRLFDIGAVQFGEFELKLHEQYPNAPKSPFYLNLRIKDNPKLGPLTENDVYDAADLMFRMAVRYRGLVNFTHIAGIPNAGDPFALAFCEIARQAEYPLNFRLLKLGKEILPDGKRCISKLLEGEYAEGDAALMVDDLITRGDSKLEGMRTLMGKGLDITGLAVLVDREQGGADKIMSAGFQFVAVYTLTELMRIYKNAGKISEEQLWSCLGYNDELDAYIASQDRAR